MEYEFGNIKLHSARDAVAASAVNRYLSGKKNETKRIRADIVDDSFPSRGLGEKLFWVEIGFPKKMYSKVASIFVSSLMKSLKPLPHPSLELLMYRISFSLIEIDLSLAEIISFASIPPSRMLVSCLISHRSATRSSPNNAPPSAPIDLKWHSRRRRSFQPVVSRAYADSPRCKRAYHGGWSGETRHCGPASGLACGCSTPRLHPSTLRCRARK